MIIWIGVRYRVGYDQGLLRFRLVAQKRTRYHSLAVLKYVCEASFIVQVAFDFRFWKLTVDSHSGFARGSLPMSHM